MGTLRKTASMPEELAGLVIVRLEYEGVHEDGTLPSGGSIHVGGMCCVGTGERGYGVDGGESGTPHWALFLFPRDFLGTVAGWFMLFPEQCAFVDALPRMHLVGPPLLH
jgi:hypothetical protein